MRLLVVFMMFSLSAQASCEVSDHLIEKIAVEENVPVKLLKSIARVESSYNGKVWAWTLNVEGKPYYFNTLESAETFLEQCLSRGMTNIDIGCMQVNWGWHGEHFDHARELLRPETGLRYAASLLKSHVVQSRSWLTAALLYHSGEVARQKDYRVRLLREIRKGRSL